MKSGVLVYSPTPTSAHTPLDRRYTERVPTHFSLIYSGMHDGRCFSATALPPTSPKQESASEEITWPSKTPNSPSSSAFLVLKSLSVLRKAGSAGLLDAGLSSKWIYVSLKHRKQLQFHVWNHVVRPSDRKG